VSRQVGPEADRLTRHELLHPHRSGEEIRHGPAVAEDSGHGLNHTQPEHDHGPGDEPTFVLVHHSVHGASDRRGDQTLGAHPDRAEEAAGRDGRTLLAREPEQEPDRRPEVRFTWIGEGETGEHRAEQTTPGATGRRRLSRLRWLAAGHLL